MILINLVEISLKYELEFYDYAKKQSAKTIKVYNSDDFYFANKDKLSKLALERSTVNEFREKAKQEMQALCGDESIVKMIIKKLEASCYGEYDDAANFFGSKKRLIIKTHNMLRDILDKGQ